MAHPDLLFWNRIEPHPRSEDLETSLAVPIRDPLWMLARQWQFGEFSGENAGTATAIQLKYQQFIPQAVSGKNGPPKYAALQNRPLEATVEAQSYEPDLYVRMEIGRKWLQYLDRYLAKDDLDELKEKFVNSPFLQFHLPDQFNKYQRYAHADILSNEAYIDFIQKLILENRIDGGALTNIIANPNYRLSEFVLGYPHENIDLIGERLLDWAQRIYSVQLGHNPCWVPAQLEYQFGLEIDTGSSGNVGLKAEEYLGKGIEWHQFDYSHGPESSSAADVSESLTKIVHYPNQVSYPGMPLPRWWEMEDSKVNFGNLKANTTSPANLIFAQFSLLYSNDWLMMPFTLPAGRLAKIQEMVVIDNFGIQSLVKHIHETAPDENWGLFQLHDSKHPVTQQNDTCLFIPPVIDDLQKSKPIEEVYFIRDEMANMVWGVEKIIPDQLGGTRTGEEINSWVEKYLIQLAEDSDPEQYTNGAKVRFKLSSSVPDHWIPFIPVSNHKTKIDSRQIQLQRASMPRVLKGFNPPTRIRPKTSLLSEGLKGKRRKPYYIYEEEVPRAGAIVRGYWKRVRWYNGQTVIWYSREKTTGRGEGSSGLKFDFLENK